MNGEYTETSPSPDTQPIDAPQSLIGRTLERRFRLEETLTMGGMGILFVARQLSADRPVVVKMLRPTLSEDPEARRRFEREIEVLSRLSHPNIVSLIDSGRDAGGLRYLALEYIEGDPFDAMLQRSTLSLLDLLEVFIDTSSALAEAHDRQIVHRDLWFDNIVLTPQADGRLGVTVLDFGVAKPIDARDRWDVTKSGEVPGTPAIVAPELVDGEPPSPANDLYSFGVLSYTALAGEPPFEAEHELELMRAHKCKELPDLESRVAEGVPDRWVDLTRRLLAKDPDDRLPGAADVREQLETIRAELDRSAALTTACVPGRHLDEEGMTPSDSPEDRALTSRERSEPRGPVEWTIWLLFGEEPVRAPMSVVIYLALILVIQILVIVYLLFL